MEDVGPGQFVAGLNGLNAAKHGGRALRGTNPILNVIGGGWIRRQPLQSQTCANFQSRARFSASPAARRIERAPARRQRSIPWLPAAALTSLAAANRAASSSNSGRISRYSRGRKRSSTALNW